jgi:hypothetical protein
MVTTREQSKPFEIPRRQSGRERKPVTMFSLEDSSEVEKVSTSSSNKRGGRIVSAQVRALIEFDPCLEMFLTSF